RRRPIVAPGPPPGQRRSGRARRPERPSCPAWPAYNRLRRGRPERPAGREGVGVGQEAREILEGFPDLQHGLRVVVRLLVAALLGGVIGYERHMEQKAAGTRTHMLVALGAALFVLMPLEAGMSKADMSRIIQGIATGIGFLGAGTIIKVGE